VPASATTGPVKVTTAGSTLTGGTFTVSLGLAFSATIGPPTSVITVYATGFAANEPVDLYAGTTDVALVTANSAGSFTDAAFTIPASAQPGSLAITAIGRRSVLATQAMYTVRTDSIQFGFGSAHKGTNPYENTLNTSNVSGLGRSWQVNPGAGVEDTPAVVGGIAYVSTTDGKVHAYNATTGATVWTYTGPSSTTYSSPTVVGGVVYVALGNGYITALNAATGALKWTTNTNGSYFQAPTVVNGLVYAGGEGTSDSLFALNASTGAVVWTYVADSGISSSSPAVSNGMVYFGTTGGLVYGLNAATGAKIWSYTTGTQVEATPSVFNGLVYIGSDDDNFYALAASTGNLVWKYATGGPIYSSAAVSNNLVYVGSADDNVYAFNATSGALQWTYTTGGAVGGGVTVANGVVYADSYDNRLYALAASYGGVLWSYTAGDIYYNSSPVVVNGTVYVGNRDDTLTAFTLPAGTNPAT